MRTTMGRFYHRARRPGSTAPPFAGILARMRALSLTLVLLVCSAAPVGAAPDEDPPLGFYVGGTFGRAEWSDDPGSFDDGSLLPGSGSVDEADTSYGLVGGYRFGRVFAVEVAWNDYGDTTIDATGTGCPIGVDSCNFPAIGPARLTRQADGLAFEALAIAPLSRFEPFAKIGFVNWDLDARRSDSSGTFRIDSDGTDTVWGAGVGYRRGQLAYRVCWERVTSLPEDAVDRFVFGATWSFRPGF